MDLMDEVDLTEEVDSENSVHTIHQVRVAEPAAAVSYAASFAPALRMRS
jgi:hypothetical protein